MGKMKEIWANPHDYPKEFVLSLSGGKERWKSVHVVVIKKKSKKKHTVQTQDAFFLDIADSQDNY